MSLSTRLLLPSHSSSSNDIVSYYCKIRTKFCCEKPPRRFLTSSDKITWNGLLQNAVKCPSSNLKKNSYGLLDRTTKLCRYPKTTNKKKYHRLDQGLWNLSNLKCELENSILPGESQKSTEFLNRTCLCCTATRRDILSRFGAAGIMATMAPPSMAENAEIARDSTMESVLRWHGKRSPWQEEFFAEAMANGMQKYETQVASLKQLLFKELRECSASMEILELGMGTGPNLALYAHPGVHVTAVDPNSAMRPFAQEAAKKANMSPSQLTFLIGVGESLPLSENSIDVAVGTLVLCSVTDVQAVLQEVVRVLKPGGRYIFLEHIAAPDRTILRAFQGVLDPLQQALADGCHLTRDPLPLMERVGFDYVNGQRTNIPGLGLLSPHLLGYAQK